VDGRKGSGRVVKTLKRPSAITSPDALQPDRSTASSVDHSPIQETVLPQIYFDGLEAWPNSSFDPTFANMVLPYSECGGFGSYFDENFPTFEEVSIESTGSDSAVDPEALYGRL
jgi:hypothetical protein